MDYKKILRVIADSSKCKRLKVGAVILKEGRIVSTGYNGTIEGLDNTCEDAENKTKYSVVHAEANAILFAARYGNSLKDSVLHCSVAPCIECAKMIRQAGISEVVYYETYRNTLGIDLLTISGVKVTDGMQEM